MLTTLWADQTAAKDSLRARKQQSTYAVSTNPFSRGVGAFDVGVIVLIGHIRSRIHRQGCILVMSNGTKDAATQTLAMLARAYDSCHSRTCQDEQSTALQRQLPMTVDGESKSDILPKREGRTSEDGEKYQEIASIC